MPSDPAHFIMITADPELMDLDCSRSKKGCAYDLINLRLKLGIWELFSRTKFQRHIKTGDRLCFYVAGTKKLAGHIIATATVAGEARKSEIQPIHEEYILNAPHRILALNSIVYLEHSPNLREEFFTLQMSEGVSKNKWGAALMGGAKKICKSDWEALGLL